MADVVENNQVVSRRRGYGFSGVASVVYVLFGLLVALLAFRFLFLLLGANPDAGFVRFIYGLSEPFVAPFYNIFGQVTTDGLVTTAVFDPSTLVAMAVYALIAWILLTLVSRRPV